MNSSVFPPPFAGQMYPAQQFVGQPVGWQPTSPARPPVAAAAPTLAQQQAPRSPIFRAKGPDDPPPPAPKPALLTMPSPEQLGVTGAKSAPVEALDWAAARRRLDRLGATGFLLEKLPQGGFRFTCLLPTTQAGRTHHVEAVAASEAEAVRATLEKSEEWASGR